MEAGQAIYRAGTGGRAWRLRHGVVRPDTPATNRSAAFARLAIADITDLRFETISLIIKNLERAGVLAPLKIAGVHATRSFAVDFAPLAG